MSQFNSEKYLAARLAGSEAPGAADTETDRHCPVCGYNLRGLPAGRSCPECGTADDESPHRRRKGKYGSLPDPLAAGDKTWRWRWRMGLGLLTLCLIGVIVVRCGGFLAITVAGSPTAANTIIMAMIALAVGWTVGTFLITPGGLDARYPKWKWARLTARCTAPLWIVGFTALWLRLLGMGDDAVMLGVSMTARAIAGVGTLILAALLMRVTEDSEIEDAARRFNSTIWLLPIPAMVLALVPAQITWITAILVFGVLVWWVWIMVLFTLAMHESYLYMRWAEIHDIEAREREQRRARRREQLEREAASRVRPLPEGGGEIPLTGDDADHAPGRRAIDPP